ncbi:MAG: single-stranded DNA-binding protein [Chloroflexota bacterium]
MLNIVFAGNVGGDVTLREVTVRDEQIKVASFSVAVDNGKNVDGEDIPPTWIRVSVWRGYADVVAQFVKKGDRVTVVAERLKSSAYTSTDGEMRSSLEVSARSVDFSGNRRRAEAASEEFDPEMVPF